MTAVEYVFQMLTPEDMSILRQQRIRLIEADLYRAHLQYEEALSDAEREGVQRDIFALRKRLLPHYEALGLAVDSRKPEPEE